MGHWLVLSSTAYTQFDRNSNLRSYWTETIFRNHNVFRHHNIGALYLKPNRQWYICRQDEPVPFSTSPINHMDLGYDFLEA